jgi:hypothetical protein
VIYLDRFARFVEPFEHWVADNFVTPAAVRAINAAWPTEADWFHEVSGAWVRKSALLFPRRLHEPAQRLAEMLYARPALARLSSLLGVELLPDPWFLEGPLEPKLGGGLHEIGPGGKLGIHVDFEAHPSGLRRVANLLIYLNEGWCANWGGALELHGSSVAAIPPIAGRAVLFLTTPQSWHGHPRPLACPLDRTRRSLALYYYAAQSGDDQRPKTVYRAKT